MSRTNRKPKTIGHSRKAALQAARIRQAEAEAIAEAIAYRLDVPSSDRYEVQEG